MLQFDEIVRQKNSSIFGYSAENIHLSNKIMLPCQFLQDQDLPRLFSCR